MLTVNKNRQSLQKRKLKGTKQVIKQVTKQVTKKVLVMVAKTRWFCTDRLRKKKLVLMKNQVLRELNQLQNLCSPRHAQVFLARLRNTNQLPVALMQCHFQQSLSPSLKTPF